MTRGNWKASTPTKGGERSAAAAAAAATVPNNILPHDGRPLLRRGWAAGDVDVGGGGAAASIIIAPMVCGQLDRHAGSGYAAMSSLFELLLVRLCVVCV